jgi:hypothetical protein
VLEKTSPRPIPIKVVRALTSRLGVAVWVRVLGYMWVLDLMSMSSDSFFHLWIKSAYNQVRV